MIPIKDFPMYGYEDGAVWNLRIGKRLKMKSNGYFLLSRGHHDYAGVSIGRIAFCCQHGISMKDLPKDVVFLFEDGHPVVCDRKEIAKRAVRTRKGNRKITVQEIDYCIDYLQKLRGYMKGEVESYAIYEVISTLSISCKKIVRKRYSMSNDAVDEVVNQAVMETFDRVINGFFIVPTKAYLCKMVVKMIGTNRQRRKAERENKS